jgi:hypothetical protein
MAWAQGIPLRSERAMPAVVRWLRSLFAGSSAQSSLETEYQALWRSWAADSRDESVDAPSTDGSRYVRNLQSALARHSALRGRFNGDVAKFLYTVPHKLAKRESQYSWQINAARDTEIHHLLEGMTNGVRLLHPGSVRLLARLADFYPDSYSLEHLKREIIREYEARRVEPRPDFQLTLGHVRSLTGEEFEHWLCRLLHEAGISQVTVTKASHDQGADLLIQLGSRRIVIQAKQFSGTVGNAAVQQAFAAMHYYHCSDGWVVTSSTFTRDAIDLAHRTGIQLVAGPQLLDLPRLLLAFGERSVPGGDARQPEPIVSELPTASSEVPPPPPPGLATPDSLPAASPEPPSPEFIPVQQLPIAFPPERARSHLGTPVLRGVLLALLVGIAWFLFGPSTDEADIKAVIERWRGTQNITELPVHMLTYAPSVGPFFNQPRLLREQVYIEKRKFLGRYPSLKIEISGLQINRADKRTAIATFEKAWESRGGTRRFDGAETARLTLRKIGSEWLIAGEEEVKVHWVNQSPKD